MKGYSGFKENLRECFRFSLLKIVLAMALFVAGCLLSFAWSSLAIILVLPLWLSLYSFIYFMSKWSIILIVISLPVTLLYLYFIVGFVSPPYRRWKINLLAIIVVLFVLAYSLNLLWFMGLCGPGKKLVDNHMSLLPICYTPSSFEGLPCDKQSDCGAETYCVSVDPKRKTGKGVCRDYVSLVGCTEMLDENGSATWAICS